jgi:hypothetical protein
MLIPKSASREEDDLLILAKIRSSCSIVLCNGRRRRRRAAAARARARAHAGRRPWPRPDFGENELDFVTIDD